MCGGGNEKIEGFVRALERSLEFGAQIIIFYLWRWLFTQGRRENFFLRISSMGKRGASVSTENHPLFQTKKRYQRPILLDRRCPTLLSFGGKNQILAEKGGKQIPRKMMIGAMGTGNTPYSPRKKTKKWMRKKITLGFWPLVSSKEVGDYIVGFRSSKSDK